MPHFDFRAVATDGRRMRGHEMAASEAVLVARLATRGVTVLEVTERSPSHGPWGVSRTAVADAVRALAALSTSGIPLVRAFDVAAAAAPAWLADRLGDMRGRVERGESVHAAMAHHVNIFKPSAVGIVRAGERAGELDKALDRLAAQLARESALRDRLLSAAIYPTVLAVVGGAAILVLLVFVLPRFATLVENTGLPLPRGTALLLAVATAVRTYWIALPVVAVLVILAFVWMQSTHAGRRTRSHVLLATPVVRRFRRDALTSSAARTLAVLLGSGVPLPAALEDTALSATDPVLQATLHRSRARVIAGSSLQAALAGESIFDPAFRALIATGEEAGQLAQFLERAAELYEQRTERSAQRLIALAEPIMILALGAVIATVAFALLQVIYGINPGGTV